MIETLTMTAEREASDREQFVHCGEACRHSSLRRAWAEIDALRAIIEQQREVISAADAYRQFGASRRSAYDAARAALGDKP